MKKSCPTWLVVAVLSCLLNLRASPVSAYYPPLQATGSGSGSTVSFSVSLPSGGGISASGTYGPGITVSGFTQDKGVMAWIVQDGSTFSIGSCTFDPFLNAFVQDSQGYYTGVSQLKVNDGVVAFLAMLPSGKHVIGYTTYDPDKATWIGGQTEWANVSSFQYFLVKEGVVAWVAEQGGGTLAQWAIRDPRASSWNVDGNWYAAPGGVDYFAITNATVYWDRASISWFMGYKAVENPVGSYYGGWYAFEITKPFAYFVAQPDFGKAPLWVWFTDMSIAGTSWNWQFGDNSGSTTRSPYHTFPSSGIYQVSLQINGPSTYSKTITVVKPYISENKSFPAILYLLLLAD